MPSQPRVSRTSKRRMAAVLTVAVAFMATGTASQAVTTNQGTPNQGTANQDTASRGTANQSAGDEASRTKASELTVMTWNLQGGADPDIPAMAELIEAQGVDVLTVQEIHRVPELDRDQVRQLADELGWSTSDLGEHAHFSQADRPGPCDAEESGWAGNAVLSKYPIAERVTIRLSPRDQDCPVKRAMTGVKLDLPGEEQIRVFTSHFTPGVSQVMTDYRQAQARKVLDYLDHDGPLLFTADVNARPDGAIHGWFVERGWLDTGGEYAPDPTHRDHRIDYIFAKDVAVSDGQVVDTDLSDHRPLVMRMTVP